MSTDQQAIPEQGSLFDTLNDDAGTPGSVENAAIKSLRALELAGALDETHALKVELIRTGARALDREFRGYKITVAATTLFTKVVDIADGLPTVQQAMSDGFERLAKELADAE